jgi:hypothetical protein
MSRVFRKLAKVLKPGAPLAFTYHHNQLDAYLPVAVAMLDAGLVCSASLPCPAEMGASIHINGTTSSIVDTVFVCRSTGRFPRRWLADTPAALAKVVAEDLALLQQGQVKPTQGDTRCIIFGHMSRLAVWNLRHGWSAHQSTAARMAAVQRWATDFGGAEAVVKELGETYRTAPAHQRWELWETAPPYKTRTDEISF